MLLRPSSFSRLGSQITTFHPTTALRFCQPFSATAYTMATKYEWLVIVKDYPNKLDERMKVRGTHLANVKPLVDEGRVTLGGATLKSQPPEGAKLDIDGSALLVEAETREEVVKLLEGDIYATSGVWDVPGATIMPFKTAVRTRS